MDDKCASNPCRNGGLCVNTFSSIGEGFRCECVHGWIGDTCSEGTYTLDNDISIYQPLGNHIIFNLFYKKIHICVIGYVSSVGACGGGDNPENGAGLTYYSDRNCLARCNEDSSCTGYDVPVDGSNWCETFTSVGATGDGRSQFLCFMKGNRKYYRQIDQSIIL